MRRLFSIVSLSSFLNGLTRRAFIDHRKWNDRSRTGTEDRGTGGVPNVTLLQKDRNRPAQHRGTAYLGATEKTGISGWN